MDLFINTKPGLAYFLADVIFPSQLAGKYKSLPLTFYMKAQIHIGHCLGNMTKSGKYANPALNGHLWICYVFSGNVCLHECTCRCT